MSGVEPTAFAQVVSSYVPPFQVYTTPTSLAVAGENAISVSQGAASQGGAYIPPFATGTDASTPIATSASPRPTYTAIAYDPSDVDNFITSYLDAHALSPPSYRYAYVMWMVIGGILLLSTIATQLNGGGGSALGAIFRKITIRRATLGGKLKQVNTPKGPVTKRKKSWSSMTIAQILAISGILVVVTLAVMIGDDFIAPTTCVFGGTCPYASIDTGHGSTQAPPPSSYKRTQNSLVKSVPSESYYTPTTRSTHARILKRGKDKNPNGWVAFADPLLSAPNTNVNRNWWTAGNRLGLIAVALLPLCVSFGLKQWPFNIWASPFLTDYHFDKTAILHRWSGRIIWLVTSAHVGTWSYQLLVDMDPYRRAVFFGAWTYWRFMAGGIAYVLLTLVVLLSFNPIRKRFYELFYYSHVVLVIGLLGATALHFEDLAIWSYAALGLWGAERLVRLVVFTRINTIGRAKQANDQEKIGSSGFEVIGVEKSDGYINSGQWNDWRRALAYPSALVDQYGRDTRSTDSTQRVNSYYDFGPGQDTAYLDQNGFPRSQGDRSYNSKSSSLYSRQPSPNPLSRSVQSSRPIPSLPDPGYARAQLLPGRTVRLTINTPRSLRWLPGQHLFLTIPRVKLFQGHPYTILSVDENADGIVPLVGESSTSSPIVLLIRAQKGFSKSLWDVVVKKRRKKELLTGDGGGTGVDLRALVSWPLGSSARAAWGEFSSIVIVCGGTGCSFGLSILEYACRRMARRDALAKVGLSDEDEGDSRFLTKRVRFVWILKEYAHLTWIAPTLRRCLEMVQPNQLQIDLHVTRDATLGPSIQSAHDRHDSQASFACMDDSFSPPSAPFAKRPHHGRQSSTDSMESDYSDIESNQHSTRAAALYAELDDQFSSPDDLVMFDGEEGRSSRAERALSLRVRKTGQLKRKESRRMQASRQAGEFVSPGEKYKRMEAMRERRRDDEEDRDLGVSYSTPTYSTPSKPFLFPPSSNSTSRPRPPLPSPPAQRYPQQQQHQQQYQQSPHGRSPPDSTPRRPFHPSYSTSDSFAELGRSNDDYDTGSLSGSFRTLLPNEGTHRDARMRNEEDDVFLDVSEQDQDDLDAVAILARSGHPALDQVLDGEIEKSEGKVIVACCGPTSLNTIMRSLVGSRISVNKLFKGDKSGQVSLVCEDFSY